MREDRFAGDLRAWALKAGMTSAWTGRFDASAMRASDASRRPAGEVDMDAMLEAMATIGREAGTADPGTPPLLVEPAAAGVPTDGFLAGAAARVALSRDLAAVILVGFPFAGRIGVAGAARRSDVETFLEMAEAIGLPGTERRDTP